MAARLSSNRHHDGPHACDRGMGLSAALGRQRELHRDGAGPTGDGALGRADPAADERIRADDAHRIELDQSFEIATISAFLVWIAVVSAAWRPSVWLPFFLVTPFIVACVRVVYITDMFHMGMTALFFALLRWRPLAAALFVIPLICARESGMFLAFIAAGFLIWRGDRIAGAAMLVCYLAGSYLVHRASPGIENVHHMPEILYLFTKIPVNFLRNWVGVELWTDGYAWCDQPFVTFGLPLGIHSG